LNETMKTCCGPGGAAGPVVPEGFALPTGWPTERVAAGLRWRSFDSVSASAFSQACGAAHGPPPRDGSLTIVVGGLSEREERVREAKGWEDLAPMAASTAMLSQRVCGFRVRLQKRTKAERRPAAVVTRLRCPQSAKQCPQGQERSFRRPSCFRLLPARRLVCCSTLQKTQSSHRE